jgi:hypothetical protein
LDNVYSSAYYDWKAPIRSLVLKENCNFALIFPKDVRKEMTFELYFFRVARAYPLERVYILSEMAPGDLEDFNYLGEDGFGSGDDIFKMAEEKSYRILHFGIGVYPKNLKVWKQQPSGFTATGWSRITPTKAGDPLDYFDGNLSPFDEPTRISETVMWLKGSVYFAFRNDEPVTVTPKLHILGAGYDTWLLADKAIADKMVKGIIPCRFISVGGLAEIQYTVPKEWEGKGFIYSLKDIMGLIRG